MSIRTRKFLGAITLLVLVSVWALVAMAFFAVLREGFESSLFLLAAFQQGGAAVQQERLHDRHAQQ